MYEQVMSGVIQRLTDAGLCTAATVRGCSAEEIRKLEQRLGIQLPDAYRTFLSVMGHGAGEFLTGTDWTYPKLFDLWDPAADLIEDNPGSLSLPPDAFVFAMHQGYQFLFLDCSGVSNPPVRHYLEGADSFVSVAQTFTGWLSGCVSDEVSLAGE